MANTRPESKRWRRMAAVLLLAGLACAPAAHAALYGYIDDDGVAHFADEKLDERYTLFMRNGGELRVSPGRAGAGAGAGAGGQIDLETHKLYRYIVNHPNIATVEPIIRQVAQAQNVDPALVKAVMAVESGFNAGAVSPKGAIGLMQVIPDTGARFGVAADARRTVEQKLADPRTNISAGVRYLRWLMELFPGNLELVLAAYNAGEGAVQRYNNRVPPFPETQQYVSTVLQFYRFYQPGGTPASVAGGGAGGVSRVKMVIGGRRNMP
ncbi:lytic transglycosylase domain-containing protein [Cupriavidus sp. 2TAF22]|uniref:lytic transglycosylase domain-containing protein n=1 Tax=unclassified Cupriavidus TaxID=2640874 RepID=UPI003F93EC81